MPVRAGRRRPATARSECRCIRHRRVRRCVSGSCLLVGHVPLGGGEDHHQFAGALDAAHLCDLGIAELGQHLLGSQRHSATLDVADLADLGGTVRCRGRHTACRTRVRQRRAVRRRRRTARTLRGCTGWRRALLRRPAARPRASCRSRSPCRASRRRFSQASTDACSMAVIPGRTTLSSIAPPPPCAAARATAVTSTSASGARWISWRCSTCP